MVIWTSDQRANVAGDVVARLAESVKIVAVGGGRGAEVKQLADRFGLQPVDDLRHTTTQHKGAWVFVADAEGVEPAHLHAAVHAGSRIATLDPLAADFDQLHRLYRGSNESNKARIDSLPPGSVTFLPALLRTAGWRSLRAKPGDLIGAAVAVHLESAGGSELPLYAHLYDVWLTMLAVADMPDLIDCSLSDGPTPSSGGPASVPDRLRALSGHMLAHARLPGRASALVSVSNAASRPRWRLAVQGQRDAVEISDRYSFATGDGAEPSTSHDAPPADAGAQSPWIAAAADAFARALAEPDAPEEIPPTRDYEQRALACCLACLLSARTREPESPAKLLQLQAQA